MGMSLTYGVGDTRGKEELTRQSRGHKRKRGIDKMETRRMQMRQKVVKRTHSRKRKWAALEKEAG